MDIIKGTQAGIELDVVGSSLCKHKIQLEFLPIHGSTALTHLGQISNKDEILRMISSDNYYLDDCSLFLPRMDIREICNICRSINKLQLYQCRRDDLLTQLYIDTLSTYPDLNKMHNRNIELEYIRHGLELMYNSKQIDNELISKHCNQIIQMSMISLDSDANSRMRDKYIDLVIVSETIGIFVISHGNDVFLVMWHASYTSSIIIKRFVKAEFCSTSTINQKMCFLNGLSNIRYWQCWCCSK